MSISEEQKKCFHFNNLQPLWAFDNISKGGRYTEPETESDEHSILRTVQVATV